MRRIPLRSFNSQRRMVVPYEKHNEVQGSAEQTKAAYTSKDHTTSSDEVEGEAQRIAEQMGLMKLDNVSAWSDEDDVVMANVV